MNYTITIAVIICALCIAFIEKKYLFSKPFTWEKFWVLILLVGTAIFSGIKETSTNTQQDKDSKTIERLKNDADSLKGGNAQLIKLVDTLRNENAVAHIKFDTDLKAYGYNLNGLLAKYGLGVDSLKHEIVVMRTKQEDIPAHIEFIPEPHNCYNVSFARDTIKGEANITNSGGRVAYSLKDTIYLVVENGGKFYKSSLITSASEDLTNGVDRQIKMPGMRCAHYEAIEDVYCIILGSYYIDSKMKKIEKYAIGKILHKPNNDIYSYNLNMSIRDFIKKAIPPVAE